MLARKPTVSYHGESVSGQWAIVRTVVTTKSGSEVPVDYAMAQGAGRWKIRDVVIDGVSLIDNYTAQIARTLKHSSYQELVGQMRARASTTDQGYAVAALPAQRSDAPPDPRAVRFATGLEGLDADTARDLDESIAWLEHHPEARIVVEGHADARGAPATNRLLAERRATAVRDYLVARGMDSGRISVVGYGTDRPLCREPREACWAMNRRAVLRVTL